MTTQVDGERGQDMDLEPGGIETDESLPPGRVDWWTVLLGGFTLVIVGWTAWLRFGPAPKPEPPAVGSTLPPLHLMRLDDSEPLVLLGLRGKVVWLVFWSARSSSGRESLPRLEEAWRRLKPHPRFALAAAAVDSAQPEQVRAAVAEAGTSLPVYLAGPVTCGRFGAGGADPPLHLLVDPRGRVAAVARGSGRETIDRLASQARGWLDEIDPLRNTRFAAARAIVTEGLENPVVASYRPR
jgi:hypothetical protein